MESRVDDNGRRLVLVQTMSPGSDVATDATDPLDQGNPGTSIATPVQPEGLMVNEKAAGVLAVLQSTIDAAREDAQVARAGARWAWAGIGALALALAVTTVVLNQSATRAEVKATMLEEQVSSAKAELGQTRNDLMAAHSARVVAEHEKTIAIAKEKNAEDKLKDIEAARQTAAVTLQAVQPVEQKKPTTQPSSPLKALVNLFDIEGR